MSAWPPFAWPPFACPRCHRPLDGDPDTDRHTCPGDGTELRLEAGIWRLPPGRNEQQGHERFLEAYRRVRQAEGWGSPDPDYLRALPFRDLTGRHPEIWRIRAASFEVLCRHLGAAPPLDILDLGAGNGWLALRLASAGHRLVAVDLSADAVDGLGAAVALPEAAAITFIRAGFDRVPLAAGSFDLAIFNGAFHYSTRPSTTLAEARRLLRPGGRLAILDSPVYRRASSGRRMLEERAESWRQQHAVEIPDLGAEGFLTRRRLARLGAELGITWRYHPLPLGPRWHLAPWLLPLLGRREPARFPVIFGRR